MAKAKGYSSKALSAKNAATRAAKGNTSSSSNPKTNASGGAFVNVGDTVDGKKVVGTRKGVATRFEGQSVDKTDGGRDMQYATPGQITSDLLAPSPSVPTIPPPAAPSNLGTQGLTAAGGLASGGAATSVTPPAGPTPADSLKDLIASMKEAPNAEKIYQKTEREVGLQEKQAQVNNFQNQINAITAKANADKLSLVGQGRGIEERILGGQSAQIDREAAIQALPISAQLAAAQGDLASARDHMDTLFKIRLQDAQAKVDYKNKVAELVYNFASEQQKIALDEKRTQDDRAFTLQRDNISYARDLAATALENGQASLAASLMRLDSSSANYAKDIANLAGGIQAKSSSSGTYDSQVKALSNKGLSSSTAEAIASDVANYGLESVLSDTGLSALERAAVKDVYGTSDQETVSLTRENVSTILGIKDDGSGKIFGFGESTSEKLDTYMETIQAYRNAGLTEQQILDKLLKAGA